MQQECRRAAHSGRSHLTSRLTAGADLAFHVVTNLGFIYFLHGFSAIWPLATSLLSFFIGRTLRGSIWNPVSAPPTPPTPNPKPETLNPKP